MGWIFYKPTYERMELVDRGDLDSDPSESLDLTGKLWSQLALSCPFSAQILWCVRGLYISIAAIIPTWRGTVPLALFFGFVLSPLLGCIWGDPSGAFIWGSLVSHLASMHTFSLTQSFWLTLS
jgi:stearoyl-CoA desaturase (delta-9 desaturase)